MSETIITDVMTALKENKGASIGDTIVMANKYRLLLSRLGQPAVDAIMEGSAGVVLVKDMLQTVDQFPQRISYTVDLHKLRLDKPQPQSQKEE